MAVRGQTFAKFSQLLLLAVIALNAFDARAEKTLSMLFLGAANYNWESRGIQYSVYVPVRTPAGTTFERKQNPAVANKLSILKRTSLAFAIRYRQYRLKIYLNDIVESALTTAANNLKTYLESEGVSAEVNLLPGDFTKIELPKDLDLVFLDNPEEIFFFNQQGQPWPDRESASAPFRQLQSFANLAKAGLQITTYWDFAIKSFEDVLPDIASFKRFGKGHPYIWPNGKVDTRATLRYILRPENFKSGEGVLGVDFIKPIRCSVTFVSAVRQPPILQRD